MTCSIKENSMGKKRRGFIKVEDVIDPSDPNIWWNYIPGFNGYELSNTYLVRSMKHYRTSPFGIIIQPKENKNKEDPTYELSNTNGERVAIRLSQLIYLVHSNHFTIPNYPRKTYQTDISARNKRYLISPPKESKPKQVNYDLDRKRYPKREVKQSKDDTFYEGLPRIDSLQSPFINLNGGEDLGRTDIRTFRD